MTTSESIKGICTALVAFHKEVGKIAKDANNPFFKSKYASLSNILDGIQEPLVNNGLSIVQFPEGENSLTTRLCHSSGEWMESTYNMQPVKNTPQDRGSAITYQRRYAVGAILSLNIDEDDDGNNASGKQPVKQQQPEDNRQWLNEGTEAFQKALLALKNGEVTLAAIQKKYKLSTNVKAVLEGAEAYINRKN